MSCALKAEMLGFSWEHFSLITLGWCLVSTGHQKKVKASFFDAYC